MKMKSKIKKFAFFFWTCLILVCVWLGYEVYRSKKALEVVHYEIAAEEFDQRVRIVQLSDVHDATFGKRNEKLVQAVAEEEPDLILLTGDLLNTKTAEERHVVAGEELYESEVVAALDKSMILVSQLLKIAPVYISYGNQDLEVEKLLKIDLKFLFDMIGAVVLEPESLRIEKEKQLVAGGYESLLESRDIFQMLKEYGDIDIDLAELELKALHAEVTGADTDWTELLDEPYVQVAEEGFIDLEVKGQKIRLGGIYGYCLPDKYAQEKKRQDESAYLKQFQDTDRYTILMCHQAVGWIKNSSLYDWNADAVFAGHVHGGQVILPGIGGLYAPDMGWFPGRIWGLFTTEEEKFDAVIRKLKDYGPDSMDNSYYEGQREYEPHNLVVSRGLGNTEWVPRINNRPEIVVVDVGTDPTH